MANWCYTYITITHEDQAALTKLHEHILDWTSHKAMESDLNDPKWLGNVVLNAGVGSVNLEDNDYLNCRGEICETRLEDGKLVIQQDTAWEPMVKLWLRVLEKYLPGATLTYRAEEHGRMLYWTNDQTLIGKYPTDCYGQEVPFTWVCKDPSELL